MKRIGYGKLVCRVLLAPLWVPFFLLVWVSTTLPVLIYWIASTETWSQSKEDLYDRY